MLDPGAAPVVRLGAALFAAAYRVGSMGEANQIPPLAARRFGLGAVEQPPVEAAPLVQVSEHLDPQRRSDASHLHRLEARGGDEPLRRRGRRVVVACIEEHRAPRLSVGARGQRPR